MTRDVLVSAWLLSPLDRAIEVSEAARAHICRPAKKFLQQFHRIRTLMHAGKCVGVRCSSSHGSTHAAWGLLDTRCVPSQMHDVRRRRFMDTCTGYPSPRRVSWTLLCTFLYMFFPFFKFCICIRAQLHRHSKCFFFFFVLISILTSFTQHQLCL